MGRHGIIYWIILFCTSSFCAMAQDGDVWNIPLDSVVVKSHHNMSAIRNRADGTVRWDLTRMQMLPQLLGDADPIRYAQMLPGFQTNDEYHSGIHVQGCDNQHNVVSIGGVPLYNVSHLLGFFSSFISTHYPSMSLAKSPPSAGMSNRLGAELVMDLPDVAPSDSSSGDMTVGLISSQGTYRCVINRRSSLTVSLRGSYMKYLYGHWLNTDGQRLDYSFFDTNATYVNHLDDQNTLVLDLYAGRDQVDFMESNYLADMGARWGNIMGSSHWIYKGKNDFKATGTVYVTTYRNRFTLSLQEMRFNLHSSILDLGIKGNASWQRWDGGFEAISHWICPQSLERMGTYNETSDEVAQQKTLETSVYVNYTQPLFRNTVALLGVRGSAYSCDSGLITALDPFVRLSYDDMTTQVSLCYARKHQYLFQTGFSDVGLPTEFWMSTDKVFRPQEADLVDLGLSRFLFNRAYSLSVNLFYKRLSHQVEYFGSVLDFMNKEYDIGQSLKAGKGENYGFSVMANKHSGKLNGWISYTYLRARRTFAHLTEDGSFAASHSRPHEMNLVLTYRINRHWDIGTSVVCASGTPYTAAQSLLLINGNVFIYYGEHNGRRLRTYMRTDISVNYKWTTRLFKECGFNFSVYNVTGHRNELFHYLKTNKDGVFAYRNVRSVMRLLPSLSYYFKF